MTWTKFQMFSNFHHKPENLLEHILFAFDFLHSSTLGLIIGLQCPELLKFMSSFLCLRDLRSKDFSLILSKKKKEKN